MAASQNDSHSSFSAVELDEDFFVVDSLHQSFQADDETASAVPIPLKSIEVSPQQNEMEEKELPSTVNGHNQAVNDTPQEDVIFVYRGEEAGSVPEDVSQIQVEEGTTSIAEQVFRDCNDLESIRFPSHGLVFIGYMSFGSCWSLGSISLPQSLNELGPAAFHDCQNLTEISLPPGIRTISRWAFHDCSSLRNVSLPVTLNVISENAFAHCVQLQSIELPQGLQVVQSEAFRGCKSLVLIAFPSTLEVIGDNIFRGATLLQEKLGESNNDIVGALKSRFSDLPLHQFCYSLVFESLEVTSPKIINELVSNELEHWHVDTFGMTPFHVVGLSSSPNKTATFQALVSHDDAFRSLLDKKDGFGKTALEYVCTTDTVEAIETIRYILNETIISKVSCLGFAEWRKRIDQAASLCYTKGIDRIVRLERIQEVHELLDFYMTMEKMSILEEALWKARMARYNYEDLHAIDLNSIVLDREASRIQCGADIVVPNVLSYGTST